MADFTSSWQTVSDGETLTYDIPDGERVETVRVRWEGNEDTEEGFSRDYFEFVEGENMDITDEFPGGTFSGDRYFIQASAEVRTDLTTGEPADLGADIQFGGIDEPQYIFESDSWDNTTIESVGNSTFTEDLNWANATIASSASAFEPGTTTRVEGRLTVDVEVTAFFDIPTQSLSASTAGSSVTGPDTLAEGEVSEWFTISGLNEEGSIDISSFHDEADPEFQFEIVFATVPAVLFTAFVSDGTTVHKLPLVDPTDPGLEYDGGVRLTVNGQTVAADLVSPSHSDASPIRMQHPTTGRLAWREVVD